MDSRRNDHESKLYKLVQVAVDRGYFIDNNGENKEFNRDTKCGVLRGSFDPSETRLAMYFAKVDSRMKDPVLHHGLKLDLINHI